MSQLVWDVPCNDLAGLSNALPSLGGPMLRVGWDVRTPCLVGPSCAMALAGSSHASPWLGLARLISAHRKAWLGSPMHSLAGA